MIRFLAQPRQTLLSAASRVGEASYRVLYTIGEEDVADRDRQALLLSLAKTVANNTAALVLKAKNVASHCEDQPTQNRVIGAATSCALDTSQLVACAKVVAPTIADPQCQDQLIEAAREVARSVEGCVTTCREVCRDDSSLKELGGAAKDVTKALNDLLNHIKDGGPDKIPDIMDQIMVASGELIGSNDSNEMVRQARILAHATAELIQAIKGEAESQSDSDLQVCATYLLVPFVPFGGGDQRSPLQVYSPSPSSFDWQMPTMKALEPTWQGSESRDSSLCRYQASFTSLTRQRSFYENFSV